MVSVYNFLDDNVEDSFGSNHGTNSGSTFTNGKILTCRDFDGSNDSINFGKVLPNGHADMSLSVWVNFSHVTSNGYILANRSPSSPYEGFYFFMNSSDNVGFAVSDGVNSPFSGYATMPLDQWVHIVCTLSETEIAMYVNGTKYSDTVTGLDIDTVGNFVMGKKFDIAANYVNGKINHLNVWDRALTSAEVTTLYNTGSGQIYNPNTGVFEDPGLRENLVSVYNFLDDNLDDALGVNDGANGGSTFTNGKILTGRSFDGSNDYVNIPNTGQLNFLNDFSISTWVKPTDTTYAYESVISISIDVNASNFTGFDMEISPTYGMYVGYATSSSVFKWTIAPINSLVKDTWHHVIYTKSSTTGAVLYIDGVSVGTNIDTSDVYYVTPYACNIGARDNDGTREGFVQAIIDGSMIHDRALTQTEVTTLYNTGSGQIYNPKTLEFEDSGLREGLVSNYNFTKDATDSLSLNDGSVSGATLVSTSNIGNCYSFDGSNDKVSADGLIDDVDLTKTGAVSFGGWFKRTVSSGISFQGFGVDSSWDNYMYIGFRDTQVETQMKGGGGITPNIIISTDYSGSWVHLISVKDGEDLYFYVNGVLAGSDTTTGLNTNITTTSFDFGWSYSDTYAYTGLISEPRVWGKALSATEIATDYNSGVGKYYSSELLDFIDGDDLKVDMVSYYKFDNNLLTDAHGTNDGTNSGTTDVTGLIGNGRGFDAVNDGIILPNFPAKPFGSINIWVYPTFAEDSGIYYAVWSSGDSNVNRISLAKTEFDVYTFQVKDGSGTEQAFFSVDDSYVPQNEWSMITCVWATDNVRFYINNILRGIDTSATMPTDDPVSYPFKVGKWVTGDSHDWLGSMDEMGEWGRVLSDGGLTTVGETATGEVADLYASGVGFQYPFDPILADLSNAVFFSMNF